MGFIRKQSYKVPEFCPECPAVEGMEQIEVRTTTNLPPPDVYYQGQFSEPLIYAHDPDSDEAGEVILGENYMVDGFCNCCEYATSRALAIAGRAVGTCTGPIDVKYGFLKRKIKKVCGAGYTKDHINKVRSLNELGEKQGMGHFDSVDVVIKSSPR